MLEEIRLFLRTKLVKEKFNFENIYKFVDFQKKEGLYPAHRVIDSSPAAAEAMVNGKNVIMFSSNNYLGLSGEPGVMAAAAGAVQIFGIGPGTSRLLSGNIRIYEEVEAELAKMVGKEAAILFSTGYMANEGLFRVLMDPLASSLPFPYSKGSGTIISDEDNHNSIVTGCRLSTAERVTFKHNNMKDLERALAALPKERRKLIATEGSFSLEGVLCPLPEIVRLAKKYNAMTLIDDAHGVGVLGENGGGTAEYYGLQDKVDLIMGSCSKALGGMGGFVAADKRLIEYFRVASRSYMFSSPISACIAYGLKESIRLAVKDKARRKKLYDNYKYLYGRIKTLGYEVLGDGTVPALPIMLHDENRAILANKLLFEKGIYVESFRWPAVPEGAARMRIVPMAHHEQKHLDKLVASLEEIGKDLNIIPAKNKNRKNRDSAHFLVNK